MASIPIPKSISKYKRDADADLKRRNYQGEQQASRIVGVVGFCL
jgi:hypothetical protein